MTPATTPPPMDDLELFQLLRPNGEAAGEPPLTPVQTREALEWMTTARLFDERALSLQRQGRFGTFSSVRGQEASIMGASMALEPGRDWLVPQYRELPAMLRHGMPLEHFALYFMGHPGGCVIPEGVTMLPIQISLAAQLPQAVGVAWGLRRQGKDSVVATFFGDGASSEGDFHEALNLAGVLKAPVIFVLQNNGWAISTPRRRQSAARAFADRAQGYGVHGAYVDGNDLFAVNAAMSEAVERARAGGGATLIESVTWRAGAHNTADDPSKYVTEADNEPWAGTDPIERVEKYLLAHGTIDESGLAQMRADCLAEVDRAVAAAQAAPAPGPELLFEHVYAEPPAPFEAQRLTWAKES